MPIAFVRRSAIGRPGLTRITGWSPIYDAGESHKMAAAPAVVEEFPVASTSSSSSIGKDSDCGSDDEDLAGEKAVESAYKRPIGSLESLEEALPISRGISNFFIGKSKSFASLSDAIVSCGSVKDLGKQENCYTRKRRNLLASKNFSLKSSFSPLRSNGGGIHKKSPNSTRSYLSLAVSMNNKSNPSEEQQRDPKYRLPPLPPSVKKLVSGSSPVRSLSPQYCSFPRRSFSLSDLQGLSSSGSSIGLQDGGKSVY